MRNLRRRDFFSSLAQSSLDVLGAKPFYGTLKGHPYTFIPSLYRKSPTLFVVGGLRLNDDVYKSQFNLVYMDKWPVNQKDISFWRQLLARHDLTDECYALCKELPNTAPSFILKAVCLDKSSVLRTQGRLKTLPVMLLVGEEDALNLPPVDCFGKGSDVFVASPNLLNIQNSPACSRVLNFFLG